ncbi:MAG: C45 family autoproteolytic acyltransferase/hydrolase [Haloferacaceae archaeon]
MAEFEVLELTGTPRERGVTHGEAFADEIAQNVETYLTRFEHEGVDPEEARERADEFVPLVEDVNESYAEEMRGVAEGSGVPLTDVTMLNVRYEVIYTAWKEQSEEAADGRSPPEDETRRRAGSLTDGCTSFGLLPSATADGNTYVGQNWDWLAPVEETLFLTKVRREEKPDHLVFTEAGIVGGKGGVNEHGIGIAVNGLTSPADGAEPFRKPFHVRCREVMDATRFDEALLPIVETHRACSANFVLGAAGGEVVDLETAPERFAHLHPDDGVLTHSNHFVTESIESLLERQGPSTLYRAERLRRRLVAAAETGATVEDVAEGLRDHFGRPASVCKHVDESLPPEEYGQTNASFVVDLEGRKMHALRGPPCEGTYEVYELGA